MTEKGKARVEIYQDRRGMWRWRLKAPNNRIIADSGEGYSSLRKCRDGLQAVTMYLWNIPITIEQTKKAKKKARIKPAGRRSR